MIANWLRITLEVNPFTFFKGALSVIRSLPLTLYRASRGDDRSKSKVQINLLGSCHLSVVGFLSAHPKKLKFP
jgi:hypothetical protein